MLSNLRPSERKRRVLYKRVFDSPDGEAVLKDLCKRYFINQSTANTGDPNILFFNEGQRVLVLELIKAAGVLPEHTPLEVLDNDRTSD